MVALARALDAARVNGVVETVPTFRSLLVYYDPLVLSAASLAAHIEEIVHALQVTEPSGGVWSLPVCYDPDVAPDLDDVAQRTGLSTAEVIERHSSVTYHVYMLGFLPGQAYMGDVPTELALPRRESPRTQIPAGSLAIAAGMTCIFPLATPCGWHLIGRSPVALWERSPHPRAILSPGDTVTFVPVSLREYERLLGKAAADVLREAPMGVAA
jgi:inhibitor of KinA